MAERVVVALYSRRQGDELLLLEDKQKPSADHILQLAIDLPPVPGLADQTGDGRAALSMMVTDYLLDEGNVVLGNGAIPISQD